MARRFKKGDSAEFSVWLQISQNHALVQYRRQYVFIIQLLSGIDKNSVGPVRFVTSCGWAVLCFHATVAGFTGHFFAVTGQVAASFPTTGVQPPFRFCPVDPVIVVAADIGREIDHVGLFSCRRNRHVVVIQSIVDSILGVIRRDIAVNIEVTVIF